MFEKALQLDSTLLLKEKRIRAKRPSEYWLVLLKKQVLTKQKEGRSWALLLFLIPALLLIFIIVSMLSGNNDDTDYASWFIGFFIVLFFTLIVVGVLSTFRNRAFVDPNTFDHLAKFIVRIKGDTFKNLIGISLDLSPIENEANSMDMKLLGLKETRQTKYKPYQLGRYQANLRLKDDSFCSISLHQISLKTTTTKRRSSGKVKSKSKHKHRFYYLLSLKLSGQQYQAKKPEEIATFNERYDIKVSEEDGFYIVKVKFKQKFRNLFETITDKQKKKPSVFTAMMNYIFENEIITPKAYTP